MSKAVPQILYDAEELLRNRKFKEALEELGEIDSESIPPDEKAFLDLLLVEANLYLGNYEVDEIIEDVVLYYRDSTETNKYARAKFLQGWLLTSVGELFDAKEVLLESYVHYKRCGNLLGQARALNRLAYVATIIAEIDSAIQYLQRCINIYDEIGDEINKASVVLNLSYLFLASGELSKSIKQYEASKSMILKRGSKSACMFYSSSAIPYALKGNISLSRQIIQQATSHYDHFPREKAIYHENLGWICILDEDYKGACEALLEGLKISLKIAPESSLVSQIRRLLGDAYLGLGNVNLSKKYTEEAHKVARKLNERGELAACFRIFAQLECSKDNKVRAREWFKKAIDLFQMIGSKYELAATRYLAGSSGIYANGERQALLFLAREYFESEKVTNYVKKIDGEIDKFGVTRPALRSKDGESLEIVTANPEISRLIDLAKNVSASEMSILLMGPTGTGKDLFARFIHHHSGRAGRFIAVNSAAIPDSMLEAELFGHRKGSFTGAGYDRSGLVEAADGGTLYLNEIAESSPEFQTKLLDALENKKIRRLGETSERKVDFRLIAATNHDLEKMIRAGTFRADLYHRINEVSIDLPSLRDRPGDIEALTRHFLMQMDVDIDGHEAAMNRMVKLFSSWDWPGNIRQLQSEIRRLALLSGGDLARMGAAASDRSPNKRDRLLAILNETGWNRREVARRLNLSEATIRRRIRVYKLTPPTD